MHGGCPDGLAVRPVGRCVGTGYISGGPANRFASAEYLGTSMSFTERIPHLAAKYDPDVVVLDGGRNDLVPARARDVFKAMTATIADARRAWPDATDRLHQTKISRRAGRRPGIRRRLHGAP